MTIYTGIANENGDFIIPLSISYSGGQKITVKADKNGAEKSIEIYAPSEIVDDSNIFIEFSSTALFPSNVGRIKIGSGEAVISKMAFYSNTGITSAYPNWAYRSTGLTIAEGITSIGDSAFYQWSGSGSLELPSSLISIGDQCFIYSSRLSGHLNIPNAVEKVGASAFSGCTGITNITIGNNIKSIGTLAFANMSQLIEVYMSKVTPPTAGGNILGGARSTLKIYVPAGSLSAYQQATGWSDFAAKMVEY